LGDDALELALQRLEVLELGFDSARCRRAMTSTALFLNSSVQILRQGWSELRSDALAAR